MEYAATFITDSIVAAETTARAHTITITQIENMQDGTYEALVFLPAAIEARLEEDGEIRIEDSFQATTIVISRP